MWDNLKTYLLTVGLEKYLPVAMLSLVAALGTFMAAHAGMLQQFGVTYGTWPVAFTTPPSGPCIVVELDTMSSASIALIVSLVSVIIRASQHHISQATDKLPDAPKA
jgi:hypothetical protein